MQFSLCKSGEVVSVDVPENDEYESCSKQKDSDEKEVFEKKRCLRRKFSDAVARENLGHDEPSKALTLAHIMIVMIRSIRMSLATHKNGIRNSEGGW
jgi:hypothetical protein